MIFHDLWNGHSIMIRQTNRDPVRMVTWSTREWRALSVSLMIAFVVSLMGAAINFNDRLIGFFRPHASQPLVLFLINFLVIWLIGLLVASYLRWRQAAMKSAELEDIVDSISPDVLMVVDPDRNIIMTSVSVLRMFGFEPLDVVGRKTDLLYGDRRCLSGTKHEIYDALEEEGFHIGVATGIRRDGSNFPLEIITGLLKNHGGSVLLLRDITERKNTEAQMIQQEIQLRQSQKMEALGLLAGGVAHDFNNLLTAILGFSHLAMTSLEEDHPARADVKEVINSAERAAKLTAQLLAVGRKQDMEIRRMDLNETVDGMALLLKRTLGEDVVLDIRLGEDAGLVEANPGGIEQVILNLAVNARDAMPSGGNLLIQTQRVNLDEEYCRVHVSVDPGEYGLLTVCDSGCGMKQEVKDHVFEPFFTTKERGKGTGLGLSMVYGIVRQCGGYIDMESEPGVGTKFRIYFRALKEDTPSVGNVSMATARKCRETILVVEDDASVRGFDVRILAGQGYRVLEAASPDEALTLCRAHQSTLDLILSDVILPGMSGVTLLAKIKELCPAVSSLYVTGFDQRAVLEHGVNPKIDPLLIKPYRPDELTDRVRQVLDAKPDAVV